MLLSTLKYLYSVEPARMHFLPKQPCTNDSVQCCIAALHTVSFVHGWFNGIEILQGRYRHGEKVGYCYPRGLDKTLCKWDISVPLVTKKLITGRTYQYKNHVTLRVTDFAEKSGNFSDKTVSHVVYTQEQGRKAITSEEILVI